MTIAERNNKLKHFITCLKCEASGKCCNDNCSTQYDAGTIGDIIENLESISKALEQETVSKESYDHEYFLRKEFELKIARLEQSFDKIRAEIAEYGSIMVAYAITKETKTDKGIEKLVSDVLKQAKEQVLDMIDKYKAESEG